METIGFIGVGRIGTEICKHLLGAGYRVVGYRRSSLAEFEKIGGTAANSPAHVGDQCDLILSCLPGGNSLDDVVMGHNGLLQTARPGQIVAELGSHSSEVKERQVGRFLDKGVTFLDGEVSGTPGMLAARKAPIYLAGDEAACNKVAAVVKVFAEMYLYCGAFGAAGTIKFVNNLLVTVNTAAIGEAVSLALKAGVDPQLMIKAIASGSGGSVLFPIRAPRMVRGDYLPAQGTFEALSHYFGYVEVLADKTGASTPMFDLAASLFCRGIERGMGEYDVAAIKEVIADLPRACGAIKKLDSKDLQRNNRINVMNEAVTVTNALPMYSGAFSITPPLGIDRGNYIALHSSDPAAAAKFAADHMGFYLLHVDGEGRHYLAAHGLDPYSLVYSRGEHGRVDHISYVLRRAEDLSVAERLLTERGIKSTRVEKSPMWRHGPALHFKNPGGQTIELTPGVNVPVPMASWAAAPQSAPGPISFDHAVVRAVDVAAGLEFASKILGLRESSRIVAPDGIPVLSFYRAHTLYHCYAVARSQYDGLHHLQFTLKDPPAVYAAAEKLKANGKIEVIWGPLRHGAGHNIAFYFRDYTGNIVEFSAEEEIILNSTTYQPRSWSVTDPLAADEWTLSPIPDAMH